MAKYQEELKILPDQIGLLIQNAKILKQLEVIDCTDEAQYELKTVRCRTIKLATKFVEFLPKLTRSVHRWSNAADSYTCMSFDSWHIELNEFLQTVTEELRSIEGLHYYCSKILTDFKEMQADAEVKANKYTNEKQSSEKKVKKLRLIYLYIIPGTIGVVAFVGVTVFVLFFSPVVLTVAPLAAALLSATLLTGTAYAIGNRVLKRKTKMYLRIINSANIFQHFLQTMEKYENVLDKSSEIVSLLRHELQRLNHRGERIQSLAKKRSQRVKTEIYFEIMTKMLARFRKIPHHFYMKLLEIKPGIEAVFDVEFYPFRGEIGGLDTDIIFTQFNISD